LKKHHKSKKILGLFIKKNLDSFFDQTNQFRKKVKKNCIVNEKNIYLRSEKIKVFTYKHN